MRQGCSLISWQNPGWHFARVLRPFGSALRMLEFLLAEFVQEGCDGAVMKRAGQAVAGHFSGACVRSKVA